MQRQMQALLLVAAVALTTLAGVVALARLERQTAKSLWGITGNVTAMIYYAAPLR
jgi:hypothetical protein